MSEKSYKRHWSFRVCDKRYCTLFAIFLLLLSLLISYLTNDPTHVQRFGAFIIGIGVWMSMRGTLREGLSKHHDLNDDKPVINGNQFNIQYMNIRVWRRGDAVLQVYGFVIVIVGSILSAYGDLLYRELCLITKNIFC